MCSYCAKAGIGKMLEIKFDLATSGELVDLLKQKASKRGISLEEYVRLVLTEELIKSCLKQMESGSSDVQVNYKKRKRG